jgi:hypothetical protein
MSIVISVDLPPPGALLTSDGRRYATASRTAALYGVTPARVQWLVRHEKLTKVKDPALLRQLAPRRVGKPSSYLLDLEEVDEKALELRLTVHDENAGSRAVPSAPAAVPGARSAGPPSGNDLSERLSRIEEKLNQLADGQLGHTARAQLESFREAGLQLRRITEQQRRATARLAEADQLKTQAYDALFEALDEQAAVVASVFLPSGVDEIVSVEAGDVAE